MKKVLSIVAVLALCAVPVMADTLELRIVGDGDAALLQDDYSAGATLNVYIQGRLVAGDTDGLALFGVNLTAAGTVGADLCNTTEFLVVAPSALSEFDRNEGLTNPPDMAASGFSGTCDGTGGLWQIGGGQNTIGNTGPTTYPVGLVETGVANAAWTTLAEGTITVTLADDTETVVLTLDTGFANTLDLSGGPSVYPVTAATISLVGDLTIQGQGGTPCNVADVNCDGSVNGGDISVIRLAANWLKSCTAAAEPRADVNDDGSVNGGDISVVRLAANWLTSTGPCNCVPHVCP